jgi:hypothetical protein
MKRVNKLSLRKTSNAEITKQWGFDTHLQHKSLYIQCNSKGEVNWDKASVYSAEELVGKDNVEILK